MVKLTFKYDLPTPHQLIQNPITSSRWKSLVKYTVETYCRSKLEASAASKNSLRRITKERPTWQHVGLNPFQVDRARLQARLLTDTLTLQVHRAKFYKEDPTCRLCHIEPEDISHTLMRCPALTPTRQKMLTPLLQRMEMIGDKPPKDDEDLINVLLGFTSDRILYKLGSNGCYVITHKRNSMFADIQQT